MIDADNILISICLPILNARKFLSQRLDSIFAQTHQHWEMIVVDGFSDDGSWEYVQERCAGDSRVRLFQAPREGVYAGINRAVELSSGEWIYIATADDTMDSRCLEVLLDLVKDNPHPSVAQCGLTLIDEQGDPLPDDQQWPRNVEWYSEMAEAFEQSHVREAPGDGALVMIYSTVITSLTQALFPRVAFTKIGFMPGQFGSAGDMAWEGLSGFFFDTHYTPERLATWRFHPDQATGSPRQKHDSWWDCRVKIGEWILDQLGRHSSELQQKAKATQLDAYNRFLRIREQTTLSPMLHQRLLIIGRMLMKCPQFYVRYLYAELIRRKWFNEGDAVSAVRRATVENFLGGALRVSRKVEVP